MTIGEAETGAAGDAGFSPHRLDPARSACVLIGVDDYEHLDPLRGVRHNLTALREALIDPEIWGLPEDRLVTVPNPRTAFDLVDPIRQAAARATDTLIVYYAGHGLLDRDDNQLHLTLPGSVEDYPDTCVPSGQVRRAIRATGKAARRVLILDCCFSGQVMTGMSAVDRGLRGRAAAVETLRDINGSYVMTSAPRDRPSHAPSPDTCTAFTGALVDVMREGVRGGPKMLGLHALFEAVKERIAAARPSIPQEPQDEDHNGVGGLEFVRNLAVLPRLVPATVPSAPPRHTVRWSLAALALGAVLGLLVTPAVSWWERAHPAPATGRCNADAVLLDHSDALDKQQVDHELVGGLSALSLVPGHPSRALALADNSPGRVFPLRFGSPDHLALSASTAITLRRSDGGPFDDWYDGESMVLEQGGATMLIGSETGPTIRRFSVATGRQIGPDFPIPKELRYWPDGGAQRGRSIESLAVSPDGHYLYAGWEGPLSMDGDDRGQNILRIQRYAGAPGHAYTPDVQYAYRSGDGLDLVDLAAVDSGQLLALERQYVAGLGNVIQIADLSVRGARDVTRDKSLYELPADTFLQRSLLLDLADCPAGGHGVVRAAGPQVNPLLDNVEGMALGPAWTTGSRKGWRPLLLVSDDNNSENQITRVYSLAIRVPAPS